METQIQTMPMVPESIDSTGSYELDSARDFIETDVATPKPSQSMNVPAVKHVVDLGLSCECGVSVRFSSIIDKCLCLIGNSQIEDESCFCEGGCGRWYHLWYVFTPSNSSQINSANLGVWGMFPEVSHEINLTGCYKLSFYQGPADTS